MGRPGTTWFFSSCGGILELRRGSQPSPWVGPGKPNLPLGLRGKAGGCARVTAGPKRPHLGAQAWKPGSQHAGEKRGVAGLLLGRTERAARAADAWKIPWTEEPGRLQSMGSQRVGHD